MDTFQQLPPPLLPDLVSSPTSLLPPPPQTTTTLLDHSNTSECFSKQQVLQHLGNNTCQDSDREQQMQNLQNANCMIPNDDSVVRMMMDCSMSTADCSSGVHSGSVTNWPPATPSTVSYSEYPQQYCPVFSAPSPSPPQCRTLSSNQICKQPQLPDMVPSKVVEEFAKIMGNESDKVVLTNSICLLFRFSIDSVRGQEVCQGMSTSPEIMSRLYFVLTDESFKNDDLILCYATGNLTNISKYEEGRVALLGCNLHNLGQQYMPNVSGGVQSLICSLNSRDSNVVIFAITAVHNLLLDRRVEVQEAAKAQIKYGLKNIVQLLANQCLMQNYEFKVIVLDCLQILAYGNRENRLIIKKSGGPSLILKTIKENLGNQPSEELIETASRVLKSLSACPENKIDIISNGGIDVLTECIRRNNQEILKTCLWTLRNLSDVINSHDSAHHDCVEQLVDRLLHILNEHAEYPCIVTCALGILANLTCNNEAVKQSICESDGTRILLNTISIALRDARDFHIVDREILEPAVCALCHLMNQTLNPNLADEARMTIRRYFDLFRPIVNPPNGLIVSDELSKAVDKLVNLTFKN